MDDVVAAVVEIACVIGVDSSASDAYTLKHVTGILRPSFQVSAKKSIFRRVSRSFASSILSPRF